MASGLPKALYWGLGVGIGAFFVSVTSLSRSSGPGGSTCSYMDYAALVLGIIAAIIGISGLLKGKGNGAAMGVSVLVIGLGVVHVLRGAGIILSPCP